MVRQRRIVIFSGRVQGVGFRQATVDLARGSDLAGTVRNLGDGRVELEIEGEPAEIDRLLTALADHFRGYIRQTAVAHEAATGLQPPLRITW